MLPLDWGTKKLSNEKVLQNKIYALKGGTKHQHPRNIQLDEQGWGGTPRDKKRGTRKNNEGTSRPKGKLQEELTPTPRTWRLYIRRDPIKEGSGVGMILVDPIEREYSHAIRLNFQASKGDMDCEALLAVEGSRIPRTEEAKRYMEEIMDATTPFYRFWITHLPKALNPKAEALTGLASIQLEFLNQEALVGVKTRPSVEAQDRLPDKARSPPMKAASGKSNPT
ncbi:hypothetical protein Tco_0321546 [Tanacetum coccineum]